VVSDLSLRQLGLTNTLCKSYTRFNNKILKKLAVTSNQRTFRSLGKPLTAQGDVLYSEGKLILRNNVTRTMDCYSVEHSNNNLTKLWSIPSRPKWENQEILPCHDTVLPGGTHRACLLVLRLDNQLERYDLNTGVKQEEVFLSDKFRFTGLQQDLERGWVVLSSTKSNSRQCPGSLTGCRPSDVLLSIVILQRPPLQFVAQFEMKKSVFGENMKDAAVGQGLLIVMFGKNTVALYSMEEVIKDRREAVLFEDGVGMKPHGLPVNVDLDEVPPCLYQVTSHNFHLEVGGHPFFYIKAKGENLNSVHKMGSDLDIENGNINKDASPMFSDPSQVIFHLDDSSRLIHFGSFGLKILNIKPSSSSSGYTLVESFDLPFQQKQEQNKEIQVKTRTGRTVRPTYNIENQSDEIRNCTFDYENELEVLVVMKSVESIMDEEGQADCLTTYIEKVEMFDNYHHTGAKPLKTVSVDGVAVRQGRDIGCSTNITLDQDTLIIRIKSSVKTTVFLYKLLSVDQVEEMGQAQEEEKASRRRSRNRGHGHGREDPRTLQRRSTWNERYHLESDEDDDSGEASDARVIRSRANSGQ